MSVGRICIRTVDTVDPEETALTAARRMADRNVGTLVVLDERRQPVGIVTDRDLTIRVLAQSRDPVETRVRSIMTTDIETVSEATPIEDALQRMRRGPCRRIPVVKGDGTLAGLLSLDDILDLLAEEFDSIGRILRQESPATLGVIE
ncbi:MAG: CBS domain-containing protein [Planctomycetaceae bacterium]|nr:CBS domain-containing protein [Planctomycetaceae bacterium]